MPVPVAGRFWGNSPGAGSVRPQVAAAPPRGPRPPPPHRRPSAARGGSTGNPAPAPEKNKIQKRSGSASAWRQGPGRGGAVGPSFPKTGASRKGRWGKIARKSDRHLDCARPRQLRQGSGSRGDPGPAGRLRADGAVGGTGAKAGRGHRGGLQKRKHSVQDRGCRPLRPRPRRERRHGRPHLQ